MNWFWFWLLVVSHLLCIIGGALIYRNNAKKAEALREEAEEFAAKCAAEAEELKAKLKALKG